MRSADKNLVQRGLEEVLEILETLALVSEDCKDWSILSLKIFLLALAPLRNNVTEHQQLHQLCLDDNRSGSGIDGYSEPDRSSSSYIHERPEVIMIG